MTDSDHTYRLIIACPDKVGIVASVRPVLSQIMAVG